MHLYIKKDGVAPSVRVQKSKEVERHAARARWYARALDLVLPGSGHLYEARTLGGLFLLAAWCILLAVFLLGGRLVEFPQQVIEMRSSFLVFTNVLGLAVIWIAANLLPLLSSRR